MLSSQGVAMATAMAAFSGTLIFLSLRRQKSLSAASPPSLRPCISPDVKMKTKKKKKKKVQFSEEVVDRSRNVGESAGKISSTSRKVNRNRGRELPANREALYNGILRDRLRQRSAYSC